MQFSPLRSLLGILLCLSATTAHAQSGLTIPLNLSLSNLVSVNTTVTVEQAAIENGQLIVTASVEGTATITGITASVGTQPVTVKVSTKCKNNNARLVLETSEIVATLPTGIEAVIDPLRVTVAAGCRKFASLMVQVSPVKVSLSDGTSIAVSSVLVKATSPSDALIGSVLCEVQEIICTLDGILTRNEGSVSDAIEELTTLLDRVLGGGVISGV